jgi:hypothetical protein
MLIRRDILALPLVGGALMLFRRPAMSATGTTIDDLSAMHPQASHAARWELISDRVMGGVSQGTMHREVIHGRPAVRMQGQVSVENNGGFIQIALDLDPAGRAIDANAWRGVEIDVTGNGETYNLHLRTADIVRPWQSYRSSFVAGDQWQTHRLHFARFQAHRVETPLDLRTLRRIGIVAIGRAFEADLAIGGVRFFA